MDDLSDAKRIERVALACIQCRSRHVKCDSNHPVCNRCRRDGKECIYQRSRRGGLDKAALARRRLRLQQEAEEAKKKQEESVAMDEYSSHTTPASSLQDDDFVLGELLSTPVIESLRIQEQQQFSVSTELSFQISDDRLLELFYDNFWPAFPVVIPLQFYRSRKLLANHGLCDLSLVLEWIGSIYASWCPSEQYYQAAYEAMSSASLQHTPFNVQALMLFAVAQHHQDIGPESRKTLDMAIAIALELSMNKREFAQLYGEANPVLEESWRRTWYILTLTDQHFSIVTNSYMCKLASIPNEVDLPCDDEFYEAGQIPTPATWQEFEYREFADLEVVYSSIAYMFDMGRIVTYVMSTFANTGQLSEELIDNCDAKIAIWQSLLPSVKKDPVRKNGQVDEVMYLSHMIAAIVLMTMHRPFSALVYNTAELATTSFRTPTPHLVSPIFGRSSHTARALKAVEIQTKLLAIPCVIERHNVFSMCICARIAAAQISACNNLLEDHALSIARDRVKLSIGFLNAMGSMWALGKTMAKDVRKIARSTLSVPSSTMAVECDPAAEIQLPRDELIWPIDPSSGIDIYSALVLPMDWEMVSSCTGGYASSN